jgi:hypothetical protein
VVAVCPRVTGRAGVAVASGCVALASCAGSDEPPGRTGAPSASPSKASALGLTRELPAAYRRVCAKQAERAPSRAQMCPSLIPRGRLKVINAGAYSTMRKYRGGYFADFASPSVSELGDEHIETNGGHWHYDVSWSSAVRRVAVRVLVERPPNSVEASACRHVRLDSQRVEACRVVPYGQGGGLHGGHIAYVWTHRRTTYVVSLHGYANEPRARAMTLALIAEALDK